MGKSQKTLLVIFILLLLGFNIILGVNSYYRYTFSYAITTIVKSIIPLVILLVYYFISTRHIGKLSVNYIFLFISIISFISIIICKILYFSLIIDKHKYLDLLYLPVIIFFTLAFLDSFPEGSKHFWHFSIIVFVILILQFILSFDYFLDDFFGPHYTNPDRYELVKLRYFSDEEFSNLPDKIPDDATNIEFYCEPEGSYDSKKSLHLEYDAPSVQDDDHHASFYIVVP